MTLKSSSYLLPKFSTVPFAIVLNKGIRLLNNKFHWLSPSGGHHSLLFDQGFQKMASWDWLKRHLTVFCIDEIVPSYVVYLVISVNSVIAGGGRNECDGRKTNAESKDKQNRFFQNSNQWKLAKELIKLCVFLIIFRLWYRYLIKKSHLSSVNSQRR